MAFQPGTSNRTAIRFVKEVEFNSIPANPVLNSLRYTGESVAYNRRNITSNEIRSDRMTADLITVGADVSGDLNYELSFASFDEIIAAALCSTWSTPVDDVSSIKNGVQLISFTIQKHFQDLATPIYQNFSGCRIGGMTLDFQTGQILTGTFSVMGCKAETSTSQITGATVQSPGLGNEPMNAVSNLSGISKDGTLLPAKIRSMSMELTNNLRGQEAVGTLGYIGIALGRVEITGNIELYFENGDEYQTFLNNDDFEFSFVIEDSAGNSYEFTFPRVKYEEGTILSGGLDQDLMVNGRWRAIFDADTNCMVEIVRTAA